MVSQSESENFYIYQINTHKKNITLDFWSNYKVKANKVLNLANSLNF